MAITPDHIAIALGTEPPEVGSNTWAQWEMWITDAAMLIETRRLQMDVASLDAAKVEYVIREAVVAQVKRPDDSSQVTISVDDASTSRVYQSGKGRVSIVDDWWTLLGLTDTSSAFSIDMLGAASIHLPWCSLMFGAAYCSCGADIAGTPIYEDGDEW